MLVACEVASSAYSMSSARSILRILYSILFYSATTSNRQGKGNTTKGKGANDVAILVPAPESAALVVAEGDDVGRPMVVLVHIEPC